MVRQGIQVGFMLSVLVMLGIAGLTQEMSKPLIENDRVRVTRLEVMKEGTLPDDKTLDMVTIQISPGQTEFRDPPRMAKTESSGVGQVHYFVTRSQRSIKNVSKQPISFIQVQFLGSPGKYVASEIPETHYCNSGARNQCITEHYLFCTNRFCAEMVTMDPGSVSTQHTHDSDHMVIPTSDFTWREDMEGKTGANHELKVGEAYYIKAGVTHRLTNVGTTKATMLAIQFK